MGWTSRRLDELQVGDKISTDGRRLDLGVVTWVGQPEDDGFTPFSLEFFRSGDRVTEVDVWIDGSNEGGQ